MTVTWILEKDIHEQRYVDAIASALEARALPMRMVEVSGARVAGKAPTVDAPCVLYGGVGVEALAERYGWRPGVFANADAFRTDVYAAALGPLFLNADAEPATLDLLQTHMAERGLQEAFVKPVGDEKEFAGRVVRDDEVVPWRTGMLRSGYLQSDQIEIVVAPPRMIKAEWRFVVVAGDVCAASLYRRSGVRVLERGAPESAFDAVRAAQAMFEPAAVYVVDVAETADGMRIVEYNTFNSAEFYACDIDMIVDKVSTYAANAG